MSSVLSKYPVIIDNSSVHGQGVFATRAISKGEIIEGAVAIAAPVFDHDGLVKGSVCIFGPEVRLSDDRRDTCIAYVREASREISSALGFTKPVVAE